MFNIDIYKNNLTTDSLGQEIRYFDKLESTNAKALELAVKNAANGTVVITDNQTAGRGRQSNKWFSIPKKSLTFSIILYPNCNIDEINKYSLIAGLIVADSFGELDVNCQLKWPNDILINGKKIGGILCESKIQGENIKCLVIGIGINVNEERKDFPNYLDKTATSLKVEYGQRSQLEQILAKILNNLENRINQIDNFDLQIKDWIKYCSHLNQKVSFHTGSKIISGYFTGLTTNAQAIILIDNKEEYFDSGIIVS